MPSPAYKGASQQIGLWFLFSFIAVAAFHAAVFFFIHIRLDKVIGAWAFVLALVPLVGTVAAAWVVTSRRNRERIQRVSARLDGAGFDVTPRPTEAERDAFAAPIAPLFTSLGLVTGPAGIQWCAGQRADGAKLFEHRYITGSGKTLQEHFHTVLIWPAGHADLAGSGLATAPWLYLTQYNRFLRRKMRERELQAPEFSDVAVRWSLLGDAATARRFLQPGVRLALERSPKAETWCMGVNWVCCMYKGIFDVPQLDQFLAHSRDVLAAAVK